MANYQMTILEHLGELRKRLMIAAIVLVVAAAISYSQVGIVRSLLVFSAEGMELVYLTPPEVLLTDIKLAFITGFFLSLPIVLYQVWAFILPALKRTERRLILPLVALSFVCFALGAGFCGMVVLPFVIQFFLGFAGPTLSPMFSYSQYVSFVMTLLIAFGIIFQLPIVIVFLARIGFVTTAGLRRFRKFAYLIMLIGSATLTPPDVVSQLLMCGPLALLYEISIFFSWLITRKRRKEQLAEVID